MRDVTWTHPGLFKILKLIPEETVSLLDLGCGRGIIGALCRIYRDTKKLVGVDIFDPYLRFCKKHNLYDTVLKWDLRKLPLPFKNNEFEVVVAIEVVEHLEKNDALKLIKEMERIAEKRVIISTPNIFFEQDTYDGNPFQMHRCILNYRQLRKLGYKVYVGGSLMFLNLQIPFIFTPVESRKFKSLSSLLNKLLVRYACTVLGVKDFKRS